MIFVDRQDAGRKLADRLMHVRDERPVVLGMVRGGIVVAAQIAEALNAPLDVVVARKVGAPFQPEFGIGAVAPGGVRVFEPALLERIGVSEAEFERLVQQELAEVDRRLSQYRGGRPGLDLHGSTAILVDDGLATGVTALAAVRYVRSEGPTRVVLAVPVCAPEGAATLSREVDEFHCLSQPYGFRAVGAWYEDFTQVEDEEVTELLRTHQQGASPDPRISLS